MSHFLSNTNHKLLGIVVPVYNTEDDYLVPCLKSLVQKSEDYIVAVVDDGSHAHTHNVCQDFVSRHEERFILVTQQNKGQNSARNAGCRALETDYLLFVDSDDILMPGAIQLIIDFLRKEKPDILVYGLSDGSAEVNVCTSCVSATEPSKKSLLAEQCSLWGLAIASSEIRTVPLFEGVHMGEDFGSVFPIIARSQRILKIDAPLYWYRQRATSAINSTEYKYPLEILQAFDHLLSMEWLNPYQEELEAQAIKHLLYWEPMRLIRSGQGTHENRRMLREYMRNHFPQWRENPYLKDSVDRYGFSFRLLTRGCWALYGTLYRIQQIQYGIASVGAMG